MSLTLVRSKNEVLVGPACVEALRAGIESCGSAVLLVPSFDVALRAQKALARCDGLGLGVEVATPSSWAQGQWELWGDGRRVVVPAMRSILMANVLERSFDEGEDCANSPGTVRLLCDLAERLPSLQLGELCEEAAGLTRGEKHAVAQLEAYYAVLSQRGLVELAHAMHDLPKALDDAGVRIPSVVLAGFDELAHAERELIVSLAQRTKVTLVMRLFSSAADESANVLEEELSRLADKRNVNIDVFTEEPSANARRDAELSSVLHALFMPERPRVRATGAVRLLEPAGPLAEAELVVRELVSQTAAGARELIVCVPDVRSAWQQLAPKLVARGISVRAELATPVLKTEAGRAFMGYARTVARLSALAATWPEAEQGVDGMLVRLGDMSWWPPYELVDFLLSDISHVDADRARALDVAWRSDRLLAPSDVLDDLLSVKATSDAVERATRELLRGRLGSAASKLLAPFAPASRPEGKTSLAREEAIAALAAILDVAGTLKELGITADPSARHAVALSWLVSRAELALSSKSVTIRPCAFVGQDAPVVRILSRARAAFADPASVDALVLCGLDSEGYAVPSNDDVSHAILEALHVEKPLDPLVSQRTQFARLCSLPRRHLLAERPLFSADGKDAYASVMLTELVECYDASLPRVSRAENLARANVSASGNAPVAQAYEDMSASGVIEPSHRRLVSVPQEGMPELRGWLPVLSASQLESYLECPLKWFSLRRLRLGDNDAGFGPLEMGTFVHRVLELTRGKLLDEALAAAGIEPQESYDLAIRLPGSHIGEEGTPAAAHAKEVLDNVFDLHYEHQWMRAGGRTINQALVPHGASEESQVDRLRKDLESSLAYESSKLSGFEPRLLEWKFGGKQDPVSYAGVRVTGTVDRVDVNAHGQAIVIDYKHKGPVGFFKEHAAFPDGWRGREEKAGNEVNAHAAVGPVEGGGNKEGEKSVAFVLPRRIQSLLYAQVVRRAFPELEIVGALYLGTRGSHELSGAVAEEQADLIFGKSLSARRLERVGVRRHDTFGRDDACGMSALLDATEDAIAARVELLRAGNIAANPVDAAACAYCPVRNCERRLNA